jgi:hypothetical protein
MSSTADTPIDAPEEPVSRIRVALFNPSQAEVLEANRQVPGLENPPETLEATIDYVKGLTSLPGNVRAAWLAHPAESVVVALLESPAWRRRAGAYLPELCQGAIRRANREGLAWSPLLEAAWEQVEKGRNREGSLGFPLEGQARLVEVRKAIEALSTAEEAHALLSMRTSGVAGLAVQHAPVIDAEFVREALKAGLARYLCARRAPLTPELAAVVVAESIEGVQSAEGTDTQTLAWILERGGVLTEEQRQRLIQRMLSSEERATPRGITDVLAATGAGLTEADLRTLLVGFKAKPGSAEPLAPLLGAPAATSDMVAEVFAETEPGTELFEILARRLALCDAERGRPELRPLLDKSTSPYVHLYLLRTSSPEEFNQRALALAATPFGRGTLLRDLSRASAEQFAALDRAAAARRLRCRIADIRRMEDKPLDASGHLPETMSDPQAEGAEQIPFRFSLRAATAEEIQRANEGRPATRRFESFEAEVRRAVLSTSGDAEHIDIYANHPDERVPHRFLPGPDEVARRAFADLERDGHLWSPLMDKVATIEKYLSPEMRKRVQAQIARVGDWVAAQPEAAGVDLLCRNGSALLSTIALARATAFPESLLEFATSGKWDAHCSPTQRLETLLANPHFTEEHAHQLARRSWELARDRQEDSMARLKLLVEARCPMPQDVRDAIVQAALDERHAPLSVMLNLLVLSPSFPLTEEERREARQVGAEHLYPGTQVWRPRGYGCPPGDRLTGGRTRWEELAGDGIEPMGFDAEDRKAEETASAADLDAMEARLERLTPEEFARVRMRDVLPLLSHDDPERRARTLKRFDALAAGPAEKHPRHPDAGATPEQRQSGPRGR